MNPLCLLFLSLLALNNIFRSQENVAHQPRWTYVQRENKRRTRIALINIPEKYHRQWENFGEITAINIENATKKISWTEIFPEWIDEEEENRKPKCPQIAPPALDSTLLERETRHYDLVVAKIPCKNGEKNWARDVFRLQIHLITANLLMRGRKNGRKVSVLLLTECRPMLEIFRCNELVEQDRERWLYRVDVKKLAERVSNLPVGSCELALKLERETGMVASLERERGYTRKREAYATSIRATGSIKDMVVVVDKTISGSSRKGLTEAGWLVLERERIRNPKANSGSYNEWNYTKLRLWQLTQYEKLVFLDSDLVVLKNMDFLFKLPEMSAISNSRTIFNSGLMVIEPSQCMFRVLMREKERVDSYNGGDQGFINEIFTWWHRIPQKLNFLKLSGSKKGLDLYGIHYLGVKPWKCYRDYDCNWNVIEQRGFADDGFHGTWWKVHDSMVPSLQKHCLLSSKDKERLERERVRAMALAFNDDGHWKINITDSRLHL
ncbi:hypothetical protein AMTRI_Chr01g113130 [Amborella trichopoda]